MLKIAWANCYAHPLPENHRFPMGKYDLLPQQLLHEGTVSPENFFEPTALPSTYIELTHSYAYWQKLKNLSFTRQEERRTGFPLGAALVEREIVLLGGTVQASLYALQYGLALNIAGGTHHAFTDRGEGFCLLNDIAVAANYLLHYQLAHKILIIDLDVHQGNGTAQIFSHNANVFTLSLHGQKNYPFKKERSTLDIELPDHTSDNSYLSALQLALNSCLGSFRPDFIFYQAGVDILHTDKLGRMAVTLEGCRKRDEIILGLAKHRAIPLVGVMGGGYSADVRYIVEAHAQLYRLAQHIFFN